MIALRTKLVALAIGLVLCVVTARPEAVPKLKAQVPALSGTNTADQAPQLLPPPSEEKFEENLWRYLTAGPAAYRGWTSWPGTNGFFAGEIPHGPLVKLYANRMAAFYPDQLPHGSILVQENYDENRQTLTTLSVMYRVRNYDPAHFDWYWIEYLPNGQVVRSRPEFGRRAMAGQVRNCIECHQGAAAKDWVFAND